MKIRRFPVSPHAVFHYKISDPTHTLEIIGDPHVGQISQYRLDAVTNDRPITPAAIATTGDITNAATAGEDTAALAWLGGLGATWYAVCGGHDLLGRTPATWATAYGMAGRDYVVDLTFCQLIILGCIDDSGVTLDSTALTNLENWLTAAGATPCIILTHQPMYNSTVTTDLTHYYSSNQNVWHVKDQLAIWTILRNHDNALAWIGGHLHSPFWQTGFVKHQQVGTHWMSWISSSSIFYTNKATSENPAEGVNTVYLTISASDLKIYVRDHTHKRTIRRWVMPVASGLAEATTPLSDTFTTAKAAEAGTSFRTCDGTGSLVIYDTAAVMSVTGGQFVINGTPGAYEGFMSQEPVLRHCGRQMHLDIPNHNTLSSANTCWGFGITNYGSHAFLIGAGLNSNHTISCFNSGGTAFAGEFTAAAYRLTTGTIQVKCVMRGTGGFVLSRDDQLSATQWRLNYVYGSSSADVYCKLSTTNVVHDVGFDNLLVSDLGGNWATDFGIAETYSATTTDGQTASSSSGALLVEHTITAATGVTQELMVRRTDDNNTWIIRMDQAGSTFKLISKSGGVETERATTAKTWTNGTDYRILVIMDGSNQRTIVDDTTAIAANVNFNNTTTGIKVSHAGKKLASWPRLVTI